MSVSFRLVSKISVKKAFDWGERPASQSERLSYAEKLFGIQRYSSLLSGDNKNPQRKNFRKIFAKPPLRLPGQGGSRCNITTVRAQKKNIGADWSGQRRTSQLNYDNRLYIAVTIVISLFYSWYRYELDKSTDDTLFEIEHETNNSLNTVVD